MSDWQHKVQIVEDRFIKALKAGRQKAESALLSSRHIPVNSSSACKQKERAVCAARWAASTLLAARVAERKHAKVAATTSPVHNHKHKSKQRGHTRTARRAAFAKAAAAHTAAATLPPRLCCVLVCVRATEGTSQVDGQAVGAKVAKAAAVAATTVTDLFKGCASFNVCVEPITKVTPSFLQSAGCCAQPLASSFVFIKHSAVPSVSGADAGIAAAVVSAATAAAKAAAAAVAAELITQYDVKVSPCLVVKAQVRVLDADEQSLKSGTDSECDDDVHDDDDSEVCG